MRKHKRRTSALSSGSSPKSPRVRQDPKIDSAAANCGSQLEEALGRASPPPSRNCPHLRRALGTVRGPLNPCQHAGGLSSASSSETAPLPPLLPAKSYLRAVTGGGPANQNPYARRLFIYLCSSITLEETGSSCIQINQKHLEEYDPELAHAVFNSQDRFKEWLFQSVSQYLISKGILNNAVGGMSATFYTMPPSTKTLEEFVWEQGPLVSMQSIFYGNFKLCVASGIGMMLVHGFLAFILDVHKHGCTWSGDFSTPHMEVMVENCFKFRINKISKLGNSEGRAKDLRTIANIFKPMFTIDKDIALYFDVLLKDLREVNNGEVEAQWYREYLLSHPALKPSTARYSLECGLQQAAASFKLKDGQQAAARFKSSKDGLLLSVLQKYSGWKGLIRHSTTTTDCAPETVLYQVLYHKHDPTKGLDPPYPATVGGLLSYKRNLLQHGHEYIKVQDHTELEKFAAKTFSNALPNIARELLSYNKMNGPWFKGHWEAYCSVRVCNDGNTEGRTGIHISFCEDVSGGGKV